MREDQGKKERKYLTNKWNHLKQQIRERQLLLYKAQIPIVSINDYLLGTPSNEEILRIEKVILDDRREKTLRIRIGLQKFVGHLKSPQVSKNIGVSDTTIREIWTGKKDTASYNIIDKVELYLNQNFGFELLIENRLTVREFLDNEVDKIIGKINSISDFLIRIPKSIKKVVKQGEYEYQLTNNFEKYYFPTPIDNLNKIRADLDALTIGLQSMFDSFIKKDNNASA